MLQSKKTVRLGLVGTSWWVDSMYLPALQRTDAEVVAVCGRNLKKGEKLAKHWQISTVYNNYELMLEKEKLDAVIISSSNQTHAPFTMKALEHDLHVLCEKPLALNYQEAYQMAEFAEQKGLIHAVPFTYSFMPTVRFLKQLIHDGFIGQPYHCNLRYYAGYGRNTGYSWRKNAELAGSGALGDIGSHFLYIAYWLYGEITEVICQLGYPIEGPKLTPEGKPYNRTEDTASLILTFKNGSQGTLHVSTVAYEQNIFQQNHQMEFHGTDGTLYMLNDWDKVQKVYGAKVPQGKLKELEIPPTIWGKARKDTVHNTYRDVFRKQGFMIGQFIEAIQKKRKYVPNFHDGTKIQRILDAALLSHQQQRKVQVSEIQI